MSKSVDNSSTDRAAQSGRDVASLLVKIQRQLVFLEKKIDILIHQSQENPDSRDPSIEKPYRKKPFIKPLRTSGPYRYHGKEEKGDSSGEKNSDKAFYSRYRKSKGNRSSGSRKKPSYPKQKNGK
jgi:hypothetical protein